MILVKGREGVPYQPGRTEQFFADTKEEIMEQSLTVMTDNGGEMVCAPGSSCYTAAGEALFVNSSGVWA
ncbi:MAG: hypothetical protein GX171_02360 [Clostridiales bacterium]|jgi:hypothetical protein|nr:hypothetical protein [Clostridiales bacterium]